MTSIGVTDSYPLLRGKVARDFGADVVYRVPFGNKEMRMPRALMERLCSPADLSILRRQEVMAFLRSIRAWSRVACAGARGARATRRMSDARRSAALR